MNYNKIVTEVLGNCYHEIEYNSNSMIGGKTWLIRCMKCKIEWHKLESNRDYENNITHAMELVVFARDQYKISFIIQSMTNGMPNYRVQVWGSKEIFSSSIKLLYTEIDKSINLAIIKTFLKALKIYQ